MVLPVKQILQVCWRRKLKWDDPLDDDLLRSWTHWKSLLPLRTQISIPRCFYRLPDHDDAVVELHHFFDASEIGYGTMSYLRVIYSDGTVSCSFVMGKSRNAPIRAPTIPRLELQSALLAVRMNNMIQRELDITVHETFVWTDSMIVLSYIGNTNVRGQPSKRNTRIVRRKPGRDFRLQTSNFRFQTSDFRFQTLDFRAFVFGNV